MSRSAPGRRNPNRLSVEWLEDRVVPSRPLPFPVIFAGSGPGNAAVVRAFDAETGELTFERPAFEPAFTGGVNVATADFTRDGYPDAVLAPGTGGGPRVRVLDGKTGEQVRGPVGNFLAYDPAFVGGVSVAAADVSGDGTPDIITAAGAGGGPHVKVFDGRTGKVLDSFFALDPDFRGGITVGAADYTGDRKAEVVVGAGVGGGPRVRVLDLTTGRAIRGPLGDFFAADSGRRSGVSVGTDALAGDVNADGIPDLATGSGVGESSRVVVYSGKDGSVLSDFSPFGPEMTAGVRVATAYVTDDAAADVMVGTGPGVEGRVRVFDGATGQLVPGPVADFAPFGPGFTGGVAIAASNDPPPVFTGTYDWSSPAGTAKVTVTVTDDAPGYEGFFHWKYVLHNIDFGDNGSPFTNPIGYFAVPVAEPAVVSGIQDSMEWGGNKGDDKVVWEAGEFGPGLAAEDSAEFSFITPPRSVILGLGEMADAGYATTGHGPVAGPGKPPTVTLSTPAEIPVNANNDNKSAWKSPEQQFIPAVRDFQVTTPTTYADGELRTASVTITGGLAGTLNLWASTDYGPGEGGVSLWKDNKKSVPVATVQIPAVNDGTNQYVFHFAIEGTHESLFKDGDVTIGAKFQTGALTVTDEKKVAVTPVVENFSHTIGSPTVTFIGPGNPANGVLGLTTESLPNNANERADGIRFDLWIHGGADFPDVGRFLQNVTGAANGPNTPAKTGPGVTLINPANELNMKISAQGLAAGAKFPILDGRAGEISFPTGEDPANTGHRITGDSPKIEFPANVGPRVTRVDIKDDYTMYYLVRYADGSLYPLAHIDWSVNFYATSAAPNQGTLTVIDPTSKVTTPGWGRSNQDPGRTTPPQANGVLYPH